MPLDYQTAASLLAFVVSFVGVVKFLIKDGPNQNNYIRLLSALAGTAVFAAFALTHIPFHDLAGATQLAVDAAGEGFTAGAAGTVGVKAYHMATDAVSNGVGLKKAA